MTNNEMVLELLELIGPDPRQNCILKGAIRQLLKPDAAPKQHEPEAEAVRADVRAMQPVTEPDTEENRRTEGHRYGQVSCAAQSRLVDSKVCGRAGRIRTDAEKEA